MKSDYIAPDVWRVIYSRMGYENALAIRLSLATGLRIGDVVSLRSDALSGNVVTFTAAKTGKTGSATVPAELARRLRQISGRVWMFPGAKPGTHRTRFAVYKDLKRVCKEFGVVENVSPHSARKTFAVEEYRKDGLTECRKVLQHDRESTTLIYALADKITEERVPVAMLHRDDELVERVASKVVEKLQKLLKIE